MILQTIAAAGGTVAFSLLFGAPRRYWPFCGFIGGMGWLCYLLLAAAGAGATVATLVATALVVLLSRALAVWDRCPATVFIIPGIFPLVPGAGIYWTAYYLVTNQLSQALQSGFAALKAAVAIVLGIVAVFEIPQRVFSMFGGRRKG